MASAKQKIHVVITGGTIDSVWSGAHDTIVVAEHSVLPAYFGNLKLYDELEFTEVCMKDSRQITGADRKNVLKTVEESTATKIIVTHGTYTMPDTAKFLQANLKRKDQTIVFTGSMTPLIGFDKSDAPFNIGFAYSAVKELPTGVYVCMNGKHFTPDEVAKDLAEGKFYSVFLDEQ